MQTSHDRIAQEVADRFSQLPQVEAIALGGSVAAGRATASSDVDIYIYPSSDLPADVRLSIGREFSKHAEISDYWGPALVWLDRETGIEVEALFFTVSWMEDLVLQPLEQYEARMGFTTSFWYTITVSQILFDRHGWLAQLQQKASQPYPDELVRAIVRLNYPLLRDIHFSYRAQIALAMQRHDLMIIQKKAAAFLASYFDILFALNRLPHPGEKRMLDIVETTCATYPANLREDVTALLKSSATGSDEILEHIDRLVDGLAALLHADSLSLL